MSPEQEEQFAKFGCGCHCIMAIARQLGRPIPKAKFIDKFAKRFPDWMIKKDCGATNAGMFFEIAKELNICTQMQTHVSKRQARRIAMDADFVAMLLIREEEVPHSEWISCHCSIVELDSLQNGVWWLSDCNSDGEIVSRQRLSEMEIDLIPRHFLSLMSPPRPSRIKKGLDWLRSNLLS